MGKRKCPKCAYSRTCKDCRAMHASIKAGVTRALRVRFAFTEAERAKRRRMVVLVDTPKNRAMVKRVKRIALGIERDRADRRAIARDELIYGKRGHARADLRDMRPRRDLDHSSVVKTPGNPRASWGQGERLTENGPLQRVTAAPARPYRPEKRAAADGAIKVEKIKTNARAQKKALVVGDGHQILDEKTRARIAHEMGLMSRATMEATTNMGKRAKRRARRERIAAMVEAFEQNGGTFE